MLAAAIGVTPSGVSQPQDASPPAAEPAVEPAFLPAVEPAAVEHLLAPLPHIRLAPLPAHRVATLDANVTFLVTGNVLAGPPMPLGEGAATWTVVVSPLHGANGPASPGPGVQDANQQQNVRAPVPPAWVPTADATGAERPLGAFRILRTLLDALLFVLRAGGLLLVPLYHRILPARAAEHPLRARLLRLVLERPGLHVAALAETLDAHPKTLAYHLRVLARSRLVRLTREGRTMRAFPPATPAATPAPEASETRVRALDLLRDGGRALTREDLALLLGVTPQAVSYHLKILRGQGKVRVHWMGRQRRYEAA